MLEILDARREDQFQEALEPRFCSAPLAPPCRLGRTPDPAPCLDLDPLRPVPPEPCSYLTGSRSNFPGKDSPSLQPFASAKTRLLRKPFTHSTTDPRTSRPPLLRVLIPKTFIPPTRRGVSFGACNFQRG